jgi:hypothetical protein
MELVPVGPVWVAWPWCFLGTSIGRERRRLTVPVAPPATRSGIGRAGLVRTVLCKPEGDSRQTRTLTGAPGSLRLGVNGGNRLQLCGLDPAAANRGVVDSVRHPKCVRRDETVKSSRGQSQGRLLFPQRAWNPRLEIVGTGLPPRIIRQEIQLGGVRVAPSEHLIELGNYTLCLICSSPGNTIDTQYD